MRITQLWPGFATACLLVAVAGCGGGSSNFQAAPAAPTASPTPTTAPTPVPTPGPLTVAYTGTNFTASSAATAAPAPVTFTASGGTTTTQQSLAVTVNQSNSTGYTATANSACGTAVKLSATTSTTGAFTITAPGVPAAGCQITFAGASGSATPVVLSISVTPPGGVILQWQSDAQLLTAPAPPPPVSPIPGPINLIGVGAAFEAVLVVTESNYLGNSSGQAFTTPVATGCGANLAAIVPATTANTPGLANLVGPQANQSQAVYVISGAGTTGITSGTCSITASDELGNAAKTPIGVLLTVTSGGIQ